MTVLAVTSSRTSPGATTLATGLAISLSHVAPRSLLIEADPSGGVLALRFDLAPAPSLASFGSDIRNDFDESLVWSNAQDLRGVHCIPSPVDPELSRAWIERIGSTLVDELPRLGAPTILDLGYVGDGAASLELARAADLTLVVTRPETAEIQALLYQVRRLRSVGAEVAIVCVGSQPHDPAEIAAIADAPLAAVLPDDRTVASALSGAKFNKGSFRRSLLWRTIGGLAMTVHNPTLMAERAEAPHNGATGDAVATGSMPPPPTAASPRFDGRRPVPASAPFVPVAPAFPSAPAAPEQAAAPEPVLVRPASAPPSFDAPVDAPIVELPVAHGHVVATSKVPVSPFDATTELPTAVPPATRSTALPTAVLVAPNGVRHELSADRAVLVGRHHSCDIVVADDARVSRRHAQLSCRAGVWQIDDLGSSNGTTINGHRCPAAVLTTGDAIVFGRSQFVFQQAASQSNFTQSNSTKPNATYEMECA